MRPSRPRLLFVPDIHAPFQDIVAVHQVLRWARAHKPRRIILLGDVMDAYGLSRFGKRLELGGVAAELSAARRILSAFARLGRVVWLRGNHEERWAKRQAERPFEAPYHADPFLSLARKAGVEYDAGGVRLIGGILVMHGLTCGSRGGQAAFAQATRSGLPVVQGHSHKLGLVWPTETGLWGMECGHLADPTAPCFAYNPLIGVGKAGWRQGFGWLDADGRPRLEII